MTSDYASVVQVHYLHYFITRREQRGGEQGESMQARGERAPEHVMRARRAYSLKRGGAVCSGAADLARCLIMYIPAAVTSGVRGAPIAPESGRCHRAGRTTRVSLGASWRDGGGTAKHTDGRAWR